MKDALLELWRARNLLINLVRRDLTVRYKSTVLGFFWSFLKPLALTGIFWLVFDFVLEMPLKTDKIPFTLHLLTAILAWMFFAGAAGDALHSVLANANLIKKVKLPLIVFPLSVVISHLIHYFLAMLVLIIFAIALELPPSPAYLLMVPLLMIQFMVTLAVCLMLSSLNVYYRDVSSLWEVGTQAWFYATPIIYPIYLAVERMQELGWAWMEWLYLANPLTPLTIAYRRVMLYASLDPEVLAGGEILEMTDAKLMISLGLAFVISAILLAVGLKLFVSLSKRFADEL